MPVTQMTARELRDILQATEAAVRAARTTYNKARLIAALRVIDDALQIARCKDCGALGKRGGVRRGSELCERCYQGD